MMMISNVYNLTIKYTSGKSDKKFPTFKVGLYEYFFLLKLEFKINGQNTKAILLK